MFAFPLTGAEPGEYELVLFVTDDVAGKTLEVSDPFTVSDNRGAAGPSASGGGGSPPR